MAQLTDGGIQILLGFLQLGIGNASERKRKKKSLGPGGGRGYAHLNTGSLSLEHKDRITLLSAPLTHSVKSPVGDIRMQTSYAAPGSGISPPECCNYRYTPPLLVRAVPGLEPTVLCLLGKHSCWPSFILSLGSLLSLIPCAWNFL